MITKPITNILTQRDPTPDPNNGEFHYGVSVWNSASYKTSAEKLAAISSAAKAGFDHVRLASEMYVIAPNRATRTWTYFDENISAVKSTGMDLLLGLTEGPENGDWNCTNRKSYVNFSNTDLGYWYTLMGDIIDRVVSYHGLKKVKFAVTGLNEPDNTAFGASSSGVFNTTHLKVMDWMATFVKNTFPWLTYVAPSLSIYDSTALTWSAINDSNMVVNNTVRPAWALADYLDLHLYLNQDGRKPPGGRMERIVMNNTLVDTAISQFEALTGGSVLKSKRYTVSEAGNAFTYGQNTNADWVNGNSWAHASDLQRARLMAAQIEALSVHPRVWLANVYNHQNVNVGDDARTGTQNFGLRRYAASGSGSPSEMYRVLAQLHGFNVDSAEIAATAV